MDWNTVEKVVRDIASYIWDKPARAETINGVRLDCVVKKDVDYWILVEVSKDNSLDKIRTDIAKLKTVRLFLNSQDIYAKCYFVTDKEPTENVITTANGCNVEAMNLNKFRAMFFDYGSYRFIRSQKKFGSAVDPKSGDKDLRKYVPVNYFQQGIGKKVTIDEILMHVTLRKHVVLLGNYGTGKSRCIQELFTKMESYDVGLYFPLAINLRDNWGLKRGTEIIRRHFEDLGVECHDIVDRFSCHDIVDTQLFSVVGNRIPRPVFCPGRASVFAL